MGGEVHYDCVAPSPGLEVSTSLAGSRLRELHDDRVVSTRVLHLDPFLIRGEIDLGQSRGSRLTSVPGEQRAATGMVRLS